MAQVAPVRPKINTKTTQLARGRSAPPPGVWGQAGRPSKTPPPCERGHPPVGLAL
jgi:hypothetical protein